MYHTHTFTPAQVKALSVTGNIVTVQRDGETYQGKVSSVEGDTWTTVALDDGTCVADFDCTPIDRPDPAVAYTWTAPWGTSVTAWAKLSQVTRGVSLAKRDK